ncbi:MAG: ribosome silencing factor [Epsilonproteobacteria bacterium]|nr:ribosome silencing factor [Campylobacterota bacterium]
MNTNLENKVENIVKLLDEKKGEDIEVFDLSDSDYIAKAVILANSLNEKHTLALLDFLKENKKKLNEDILGYDESEDWVVIDLNDILVHIMTPQYRMRYAIEEFLKELKEGKFNSTQEI